MATRLPAGCSYIKRAIDTFRNALEDAVFARHRKVTEYHAATINSACRHEQRALLLLRWLREAAEPQSATHTLQNQAVDGKHTSSVSRQTGLGVMDRAALLSQISDATDKRDRCLERLGLNEEQRDSLAARRARIDEQFSLEEQPANA